MMKSGPCWMATSDAVYCSDHRWQKTEHQNPPSEALPLLTVVFRLAKPEVKTASNAPNQVPNL